MDLSTRNLVVEVERRRSELTCGGRRCCGDLAMIQGSTLIAKIRNVSQPCTTVCVCITSCRSCNIGLGFITLGLSYTVSIKFKYYSILC